MTAPANDDFTNRIVLGDSYGNPGADPGSRPTWRFTDVLTIAEATLETGEPQATANMIRSVWFEWTCPVGFSTVDGFQHFQMAESSSDFNPVLGLYQGTDFGDMVLLDSSDAELGGAANIFLAPTEGETYFIQAGGPADNSTGSTYRLLWDGGVATWPWHVVDSAAGGGAVYRLGPDSNPDGGIARVVMPDGTVYVQSPEGTPLTIVDASGYPYPLGQLPFALEAPWLQDEVDGATSVWLGADFTAESHNTFHGSGFSSAAAVSAAITAELANLAGGTFTAGAAKTAGLGLTGGFGAAVQVSWNNFDGSAFTTPGSREDHGMYVDATGDALAAAQVAYTAAVAAAAPPGTTVEYEDDTYTVLSVNVSIPMQEFGRSDSAGRVITAPLQVDVYSRAAAYAADVTNILAGTAVDSRLCTHDGDSSLGSISASPIAFDSTDFDPATGGLIVWAVSDPAGSGSWSVDSTAAALAVSSGFGVAEKRLIIDGDPTFTYTFRGPRYRYL